MIRPRPYQLAAAVSVLDQWKEVRSTLVVMPTGTGKTILMADIIRRCFPKKALILAHREELIFQARDKIHAVTGYSVEVEMADFRAQMQPGFFGGPQVVVSSIQTQTAGGDGAGRMGKFDPNDFGILMVDECFPAGTLVDGRPIESFCSGDRVTAFDHATGCAVLSRVVRTLKSKPAALVSVRLSNGSRIVCTPGHPIYRVETGSYVPAVALSTNSPVLTLKERPEEGCLLEVARVDRVEILEPRSAGRFGRLCPDGFVYNLEVESYHNYFANGVLVHNCHHGTAASYRRVLDYYRQNPLLKILGVTATPDRADEEALGQVFDTVAYDYEVMDAIRDGWLVPIEQQVVEIEGLDFSGVRTTAGDLNGADLAAVMEAEKSLHGIADASLEIAGNRRSLVFTASVKQAEQLAEIFNRHREGSAAWVCGKTPKDDRRRILSDFTFGKTQFLCNVGVLTEGFDDPGVELVVMGRPTKSRALYAQMVGRAFRPLPGVVDNADDAPEHRRAAIAASRKPTCLVVDFVGNAGRHKLMSSADILGGNFSDEAVDLAALMARKATGPLRMDEALEMAEEELRRQAEERRLAEAARRAKLVGKARFNVSSVNPFDVLHLSPVAARGWDKGRQVSEKQRAMLNKHYPDINIDELPYAQAKQLCGELFRRWDNKLCTYKQAKLLAKHGYETKDMSIAEAGTLIDRLAANGWRRVA